MNSFPPLRPEDLPAWTDIGKYLDDVRSNLDGRVPLFINAADKAMSTLIRHLSKPNTLRSVGLINYAYSNWRAAVVLGQTGNAHQVPLVLRPALEALLYAHLFLKSDEWRQCWERRHSSKKAANKFREKGPAAARGALKSVDAALEQKIKELTQEFIDFGGHPNVGAIETSSSYFTNPDDPESGFVLFTQLAGERRRYEAQLSIMRTADITLRFLRVMWPERYTILCIDDLQRDFQKLAALFIEFDREARRRQG